MKIHFIQQDAWVVPGAILAWAQRRQFETVLTRCWLYEPVPDRVDADMLVVLGGHQSPSTTREECETFDAAAEMALIRRYAEAGKIVFGVCLGAQLLGQALGAPYGHSPEREIGPVKARLTPAGREDPFLRQFPACFDAGAWHNDMPGLTPDAVILAESDGCPRQIVRYGRFLYGFQTHMEFTHDIVAAGLKALGDEVARPGLYIQTPAQLLAYDYTDMNRLLSTFLDAITDAYLRQAQPTVAKVMEKMIAFSEGNLHDIDHFIRVWTYAKTICELEGVDPETQYITELAALTHDIACPLCREKYGSTNGKYQEAEGEPMVRSFLSELSLSPERIDRVAFLVAHHHTLTGIDSPDWQILVEADYIANACECGCSAENIRNFMARIMRTETCKRLCRQIFQL